jgi:uncharacterized membrane protein
MGASILLAATFAAVYFWSLHERHTLFDTYAFDLGLIGQATWNNLRGAWFATTVLPVNYAAEHFAPVLVPAALLFRLWPDIQALLLLQAVAVSAAGVGIYLAAWRRLGDPLAALLLQISFTVAPATAWVVRDEFHPIALAMPVIGFATWLLWSGRVGFAALVAALALLANEDAALWVFGFGALVLLGTRGKRRLWGASLLTLGALWLGLYLLVLVPAVRPASAVGALAHPDIRNFGGCGDALADIAGCLVNPSTWVGRTATPGNGQALWNLLAPTGGLGLLGPSLLAAVPRWLTMLLGNQPPNFQAHYVAILVAAAYLTAVEASSWLRRWLHLPPRAPAAFVAACSLGAFLLVSPLPGGGGHTPPAPEKVARAQVLEQAVRLVPADPAIGVAATGAILPHVALRPRAFLLFEFESPPPDYRVLDLRDRYPFSDKDFERTVALYGSDADYQPIFSRDDVLVFKRAYLPPDRTVGAVFSERIRFEGYSAASQDDRARLDLYWRAQQPMAQDYHFFVHLIGPDGRGFSQYDGEIARGYLPASRWPPGKEVRERLVLAAPPPAAWAGYHFEVGWYDLMSGKRLGLGDGRDFLTVPLEVTAR